MDIWIMHIYKKKKFHNLSSILHPPYLVGHPRNAQLAAEHAPFAAGGAAHGVLQVLAVALAIGLLDVLHVEGVPVEAHEARDEQFAAQRVLAGGGDGVLQEEGVADGAVNDAVEDVCQEFALDFN